MPTSGSGSSRVSLAPALNHAAKPAPKVVARAAERAGRKRKREDPSALFPNLGHRAVDKLVLEYPGIFAMLDAKTRKELAGAAEAEAYAILDRFVAVNYGNDDVEEADDAEMLEPTTWPQKPSPGWYFVFNEAVGRLYPFRGNPARQEKRAGVVEKIREHWSLRAPGNTRAWTKKAKEILDELEVHGVVYTTRRG
ncbi:hypothetical protein DIPPA_24196 [Diplonema papillatum]|nr:hypothetical protein DIPPA_24196 [Diplonema papillatum]